MYRVVQESLTNVIKHAGPAARAAVTIDYLDDAGAGHASSTTAAAARSPG